MPKQLLIEKHRPSRIKDYLFQDSDVERKVMKWISQKDIPNIMFSGSSGTGKSSLSKIILNELEIDPSDVLYVNASLDSGIDVVRDKIEPFIRRSSFGDIKVVQLEEADRASVSFQQSLRSMIEDYSGVRWIVTCNYPKKIIDPLHSRLQHIELNSMNEEGILDHIADIIDQEDLTFNNENDVISHIEAYAPDMRKIINSIDEHTDDNRVIHPIVLSSGGSDEDKWQELWSGKFDLDEAVKLVGLVDQSNFEWFYSVMYNNHDKFPDPARGIVIVSKYLDRAMRCANQPLHLHACLYELFVLSGE